MDASPSAPPNPRQLELRDRSVNTNVRPILESVRQIAMGFFTKKFQSSQIFPIPHIWDAFKDPIAQMRAQAARGEIAFTWWLLLEGYVLEFVLEYAAEHDVPTAVKMLESLSTRTTAMKESLNTQLLLWPIWAVLRTVDNIPRLQSYPTWAVIPSQKFEETFIVHFDQINTIVYSYLLNPTGSELSSVAGQQFVAQVRETTKSYLEAHTKQIAGEVTLWGNAVLGAGDAPQFSFSSIETTATIGNEYEFSFDEENADDKTK